MPGNRATAPLHKNQKRTPKGVLFTALFLNNGDIGVGHDEGNGLLLENVAAEGVHALLAEEAAYLLKADTALLGDVAQFAVDILFGGLDAFCGNDGVKGGADMGAEFGLGALSLAELLHGAAGNLKILLDAEALLLNLLLHGCNKSVDLALDGGGINFHFGACCCKAAEKLVHHLVFGGFIGCSLHLLAENLAHLLKGCKTGSSLSKGIVHLIEGLQVNFVELALEDSFLACQIGRVVNLGESDMDINLSADFGANKLLFEAGDEGAGAKSEGLALGSAACKLLLADKAGVVDDYFVTQLSGAIGDILGAGVGLADAL